MGASRGTPDSELLVAQDRLENRHLDSKSTTQLLASTIGSVATALPLLKFEGPLKEWLDLLSTMLKHGG